VPGLTTHLRRTFAATAFAAGAVVLAVCLSGVDLRGDDDSPEQTPIVISGDYALEWVDRTERVAVVRGHCRIVQDGSSFSARQMVIWRRTEQNGRAVRTHLSVYLEDDVRIEHPGSSRSDSVGFIDLTTSGAVQFSVRDRVQRKTAVQDALFRRAAVRRRKARPARLRQTQLAVPGSSREGPELRSLPDTTPSGNLRRVRIFPRSKIPYSVFSRKSERTTPPEQVTVLKGGINMIIDGVERFGTIDLSADRMVIWTRPNRSEEFRQERVQTRDEPFQVYLEGNIVIRQGTNVLRAQRAVYDAREDRALLLDAELRSRLPQLQSDLRVRAERIRQLSQSKYHAQNAFVTASEFGKPGYRLQSSDIFLEQRYETPWVGLGTPPIDPETGAPIVEEVPWITNLNNTFFVEDVPLLYTPYLSAPAKDPNIPLRRLSVGSDRIFGGRLKTAWNFARLLGWNEPEGVQWDLLADYYTSRGAGIGTAATYHGNNLLGLPGSYRGKGLEYYINDGGDDNLGSDRRSLAIEDANRYRLFLRHRQDLPDDLTLFAEIDILSDSNFLEQYYEREFDKDKDNESLLYARQIRGNAAWTGLIRARVNDFTTTSESLPRGDLFLLAEPLLNGLFTWSSHTSAGYSRLRPGDAPSDPADTFTPLPFVANAGGAVLMTRHELDMPFSLGPVHIVPYALGDASFWGEGLTGSNIDRFVGSAGVRASLLFWKVFPNVRSDIFNLSGLAHKARWELDYSYTDSTRNLAEIAQYNEFDDNAQERFRERLLTNTFRGVLPPQFAPRFYAVRAGAGRAVTSPYNELIDDQQVLRMALRQRLQTKVGPPDRRRIKDWMTLDLEASYFPNAAADNFGEDIGLIGARYRWNLGDRTSVLAGAQYDLFDNSQQLWDVGIISQRSRRGSVYMGVRQVKGANLDSQIFSTSASYRMSEKWIATISTAYDIGEAQNRGQTLTITRIGADFLIHVGANFDASKNNAGIVVSIEPRIAPLTKSSTRLGSLLAP